MTVGELIEALKEFDTSLPVYGVSDHGQVPDMACTPSYVYADEDAIKHSLWDCTYDLETAEEYGYTYKGVLL